LLKWDIIQKRWYVVPGTSGVKIGVFNEVSAAVLDAQGRIYVSSDNGFYANTSYLSFVPDNRNSFQDSAILNETSRQWIKSLI